MAKYYGYIPCVKLDDKIHITISGTKCLCGVCYAYSKPDRQGKSTNIIWRELETVTCGECKEAYQQN